MMKPNLLNFDLPTLTEHFAQMGEKPFRAKQVMRWIHQSGAENFDQMTDLAKSLRAKLNDNAQVGIPALITSQESKDGTRKWLLDVGTGNGVETVLCVFHHKSVVLWNARFVPLGDKALTAIYPLPKSSGNCGGQTKR